MNENATLLRTAANLPMDPRHRQLLLSSADEIDTLRAELVEFSKVAECAWQSWRANDFDVAGNQRALIDLTLRHKRD